MDKNNQGGNAMTKPLPYGCIKKEKTVPDLQKFYFILQNLSIGDKIGHLFDVKTLLSNEIYTSIFEKKANQTICNICFSNSISFDNE